MPIIADDGMKIKDADRQNAIEDHGNLIIIPELNDVEHSDIFVYLI